MSTKTKDSVGLPPGRARHLDRREMRSWSGRAKAVWRRFQEDKGPVLAAALTFFGLLALVPLMLIGLAVMGYFITSPQEAIQRLRDAVSSLVPGQSGAETFRFLAEAINLEETLRNLMNSRGVALAAGILTLLWAGLQLFVHAAPVMNAAFDTKETRSWIMLRLQALGVMIGAGILFLLSISITSLPDVLRGFDISFLGLTPNLSGWVDLLFVLVGIAISALMFAVIYRFLPDARISWPVALVGGVATAVLWEIAKKAFGLYLANFGAYDKLYGALGGVMLLVTWMYYSNFILLLGAEIAAVYRAMRLKIRVPDEDELNRSAVDAVYRGHAVPLSAAPHAYFEVPEGVDPVVRAKFAVQGIKRNVREMGDEFHEMVHGVKTTPVRSHAERAFADRQPAGEDRREMEVAPTAEERRPPEKAPRVPRRELYGALGGETAPPSGPDDTIRLEKQPSPEEKERWAEAEREFRERDYPPAEVSKARMKEAMNGIKGHIQEISGTVKSAAEEIKEDAAEAKARAKSDAIADFAPGPMIVEPDDESVPVVASEQTVVVEEEVEPAAPKSR